jgi:hypothetical protein
MVLLIIFYTFFFLLSLFVYFIMVYFAKFNKRNMIIFCLILFFGLSSYITHFLFNLEDKPAEGSKIITKEEMENW